MRDTDRRYSRRCDKEAQLIMIVKGNCRNDRSSAAPMFHTMSCKEHHIISTPTLHNTVHYLNHSSHCHPSPRLILFYSPSDNDTKSFKEKYIKLAASLRANGIKTGAVNCEKEADLCDQNSAHHLTGEARGSDSAAVSSRTTSHGL